MAPSFDIKDADDRAQYVVSGKLHSRVRSYLSLVHVWWCMTIMTVFSICFSHIILQDQETRLTDPIIG